MKLSMIVIKMDFVLNKSRQFKQCENVGMLYENHMSSMKFE